MARAPVWYVSDFKAWGVLLSPVRFELVEAMRSIAPCSIAELADTLMRPADALYRHIELLQGAGFIVTAGFRKLGRHTEQLFDLTADDFRLDLTADPTGKAAIQSLIDTARTTFQSAEKVLEDSANAGALVFGSAKRNIVLTYELAWLSEPEYEEVLGHIRAIKKITDRRGRRPGSTRAGSVRAGSPNHLPTPHGGVSGDSAAAESKLGSGADLAGEAEVAGGESGRLYAVLSLATPVTRQRRKRKSAGAKVESGAAEGAGDGG